MDFVDAGPDETGRKQVNGSKSRHALSLIAKPQAQLEQVHDGTFSSDDEKHGCASSHLEQVTCTGVQVSYPKGPGRDFHSRLTTRTFLEPENGEGSSSGTGLRLPSTRVTVYPQRDIISSLKGRRDFSLPRLDVLKVQLETRGTDEEYSNSPRSLSVSSSAWLPACWGLGRTHSADSYFQQGRRHAERGGHFETRAQMERAFNTYVKSKSQPPEPPGRPNTTTSTSSSRQASASSNRGDATVGKTGTLTWYSAPNRQRVVRKSPPWRSLMNRRPRGVRADNTNLCPYHCRCCFNEVNDIESTTIYKMDLGAL